jgi:hypothetical protein
MKLINSISTIFVTKFVMVLIILLISAARIAAQDFAWARAFGSFQSDKGNSITVDENENVYTTGLFQFTVDFDPGAGVYNLTGGGAFVSKLDAQGNFIWAKKFGGLGDNGKSVRVDDSGYVYTVGQFYGTADFDPGPGTFYLHSDSSYAVFISKLDSMGNFVWAKKIGATEDIDAFGLVLDSVGNPVYTGTFNKPVDFDPNAGNFLLTPTGGDTYVSKLDKNGNFLWARQFKSTAGYSRPYAIGTDAMGNIITCGAMYDTVDFDPGPGVFNLTKDGLADIFISKLDASGNFVWAGKMGGSGYDLATCLAVDELNNMYLTGSFSDTADFDPGVAVTNLVSSGTKDHFVAKLDASGNFLWARQFSDTNSYSAVQQSVCTDLLNNVYVSGAFNGTTDFDPGPGTFNLTSPFGKDIFVTKLDSSGTFVWARQMSFAASMFPVTGVEITVTPSYQIYSIGNFAASGDLDPGAGNYSVTSAGQTDWYIQKLFQCFPTLPINTTPPANLLICNGDSAILSATGNGNLVWYSDSVGGTYLGAGNTFTTPILADTTTFYVFDTTQCSLSRTGITVNVIPNSTSSTSISICANQTPYMWNAQSLDSTGMYTAIFTGINGCDSIATLNLNVSPCIVCVPNFTINYTPFYNSLTESQTWITTSGTVLILAGDQVKLDANSNSYVSLNPGFKAEYGSLFIAQAYNGCTAGAPQLPQERKMEIPDLSASNEIVLYPNPTNGMIHIQHDAKLTSIQIFDMVGKLVINQKCNGEIETNIDLRNLPNGVYHVKAAGYHSVKVVKSN